MRVLKVLSQSFTPDQARFPRIFSEAQSLIRSGHQVLVFGWDRAGSVPPKEDLDGFQVERVSVRSRELRGPGQIIPLLRFSARFLRRIWSTRFDVVHCHNLDVLPIGYLLKKFKGSLLVFDAHEPNYYALWPRRWRWLLFPVQLAERILSKRADYVIVTNQYQMQKYKKLGVKNLALIGNYPIKDYLLEGVRSAKFSRKECVFGRLGTLYPAPGIGIKEMVEAFKLIAPKYPQARLFLAGRVVPSYRQELHEILEPVRDRATIVGAYEATQIPSLYAQTDVSLLPYHRNDWFRQITPTKFYDSLAQGVPVIMTDIGGLGSVIREGRCGFVIDEHDIEGIAKAMEAFLLQPKLRQEMAQNALYLAQNEYNWDLMQKKLAGIYEELQENGRR